MAEIALREAGWRADSYGAGHPVATLMAAIRAVRPRLFWLSVSTITSVPDFLTAYAELHATAVQCRVAVVVGGRALTEDIRRSMQYSAYGDTMRHLVSLARTLNQQG